MRKSVIDIMYKDCGYWVINGAIGRVRYLYYTKAEARKRYIAACRERKATQ